jgi:hypothetical protein
MLQCSKKMLRLMLWYVRNRAASEMKTSSHMLGKRYITIQGVLRDWGR